MIKSNYADSESMDPKNIWCHTIQLVVSLISILGSGFIVIVFLCYKKLRCFAYELVVYLTFASAMNNVSYIINYIPSKFTIISNISLCKFQAFIMIWFELSQFIWVTLIGYSVYDNVIHFDYADDSTSACKRMTYLVIGFIVPVVFSFFGLITNLLGPSGNWCWITYELYWGKFYSYVIFGVIWLLISINLFFTFRVIRFLNNVSVTQEEKELTSRYIWKLARYVLIEIICTTPQTISRIVFISTGEFNFLVQLISLFFISIQGILYAIAYGYNPQVRLTLRNSFLSFCRCTKKRNSTESFLSTLSANSKDLKFKVNNNSSFYL